MIRSFILLGLLLTAINGLTQTLTPSGSANYCVGGSITLTVSGAAPGSIFTWKKDGNTVGGNNNTFTANTDGSYSVIITGVGNPDTLGPVVVSAVPNPVADFSFTPNNACSGTNINFTSNASGGNAPYRYAWDFDDGGTSTNANPIHAFTSLGCGTGTFNVKLIVTDSKGCTHSVTKTVSVKQAPDVQISDQNIFSPFSNCSNSPSLSNPNFTITILNSSPSASCISNYDINWGDGNIQNNVSFPLTHTYTQLGAFNLTVTATGNGCTSSKSYTVANQSNPAGSLGTLGSTTNLCAPATVPFTISNWTLNSPGTTYILDFGDGTSITLNHPLNTGLTPDTVNHTYTLSSCPSSSYTATLRVVNACDNTPYTAGNIQIRIKPSADFDINSSPSCTGRQVCFNNNTTAGSYGPNCNTIATYSWDFGDGSPTSTLENPCHTYATAGTFTVTLSATNPCGTTTKTKQVCIVNPLNPGFTLNNNTGCLPLTVNATDTTNITGSCQRPTYRYSISYASAFCGTTQGYTFINGTSDTSANPSIRFDSAGTYTITQTVTNACGSFTSFRTIDVKKPPKATISIAPYPCGAVTVSPVANATNCGTAALTYAWTFTGGSIATDNTPNPTVSFSTPGVHPVKLVVTNECGSTVANDSVVVSVAPDINPTGDQTLCGGKLTTAINFSSNNGTPVYEWTNNNTSIGLPASGTGNIAPFIGFNIGSNPAIATIIVTPVVSASCKGVPDTFRITVNPVPAGPQVISPVTYCLNEPATALTAITDAGNIVTWYNNAQLLNGSTTAPVPVTTATGTTTYYVTQTNSYNCISRVAHIDVIVNPGISGNTINPVPAICAGTAPQTLSSGSISGGSGSYTYQWQSSLTGIAPWTNIPGATNASYDPPVLNDTIWYRRIVNGTPCSDTSNIIRIVVQDALTDFNIAADQVICAGVTPALITGQTPNGGGGGYTYKWYSSTDNINWTEVTGATATTYQPGPLTVTTYFKRLVNAANCSAYSNIVTVTVNPTPGASITANPSAICTYDAGAVSFTASAGTAPFNITLQITNPGGSTSSISQTINNNGPVSITVVNAGSAPGNYTIQLQQVTDNKGCTASNLLPVAVIRVKPLPVLGINANPPSVCAGNSAVLTATGADSYRWSPATTLSSSTGSTVTATPSATTTYTMQGTKEGCIKDTTVTVTVIPGAVAANAGPDQRLCNQNNTTLAGNLPSSNATGAWSQVSGPAASISNPAQNNSAITGLTAGRTYIFRWTITGQAPCPPTTSDVQVDVFSPVVNSISNDTIICAGQTAFIYTRNLSGGNTDSIAAAYTYQWESAPQNTTNWQVIAGENRETLSVTPTVNTCYRRKVKTNGICEEISNIVCVTVNPAISNNNISAAQQVCVNTPVANLTGSIPIGGDNNYAYNWETSTDSVNWNSIANLQNYQPPVYVAAGVHFFRRAVSSGNCTSMSNVVKVVVHPDAKAIYTGTSSVACAPFNLANVIRVTHLPDSNGTYNWYANNTIFGSNTTGVFPGYIINNPGDTVNIKLVTISPFGCKSDSVTQQFITVKTAVASFRKDTAGGCGPLTVNFTNTTNIINNTIQFFWNFGNGQTSTLSQPGPVTYVQSPYYSDTTYQVTLKSYNGCDTTVWRDSIKIRSNPKARFALDTTAGCSPFKIVVTNNSLGTPNTYYWDFGNGHKDTTYSNGSFNYTYNIGNTVDTFPIRLIAVNECASDTQIIKVRVAPNIIRPQVTIGSTELYGCAPHSVSFNNATTGATSFVWNYGDGSTPDTTNIVQNVVTHIFNTAGVYNVAIEMTNGCSDTTVFRQVTVYAKPIADFSTNAAVYCLGDTVKTNNLSQNANSYRWFWGNGQNSSGFEPAHVYTTAGNYDVMLRAERTNISGLVCYDTTTRNITVLVKPNVAVQSNASNNNCAPFTYNASAPGIINEAVSWYITDTTVSPSLIIINGTSVSYTFNKPGSFSVKMIATNSNNCKDSTTQTFIVRGTPVAAFTPGNITICKRDTTISYQNNTSFNDFGPITYRWLVNGVLLGINGNFTYHYQVSPLATLPATFTTQLVATNTIGCSDTAAAVLQVNPNPVAQFSISNTQQCVPFILPVNNVSQYATRYKWMVNGVLADTTANPSIIITQAQTAYTVMLIADNGYGCKPDTFSVGFTSRIKPQAVFSVNDTLGCNSNLNVVTVNTSRFANSYTWDWGDATPVSFFPNPSHLYTVNGQYVISLIASDGVCKDTAYKTVHVSDKPLVDFAIDDSVTCDTARVKFTNLTRNASRYLWSFSDGSSSTDFEPAKNFAPSNSYYSIKLVAYNALGCKDSVIKPNLVLAKVPPAGDFIINPSPVINIPQYTFSFQNLTTNSNQYTYQWDLGDGSFAGTRDVVHKYADTGTYIVTMIVFDNKNGCPDTTIKIAKITGAPGYLYVPNAFYPNSLQQQFRIFKPLGKGLAEYHLQVFDAWGKLLFETKELDAAGSPVAGWDGTFNGKPMPQDAYAWRIRAIFRNGKKWDGMSYSNNLDPSPGNTFGTVTLFR